MAPTTYVARQPGLFSALLSARDLGGYRLRAMTPRRVNDRYEDTDDGALLAQGLMLRLREQEGEWSAALRPIRRGMNGPSAEAQFGVGWAPRKGPLPVPEGDLATSVRAIVGTDDVKPLLRLRQYRTPRLAYDGERLAALLSFDVVVYEVPGAHIVSNELEVELAREGTEADLARLAPVLREHGLEAVRLSKLERGVLRLHRGLYEPLLLLPDERRVLSELAGSDDPAVRRRARVVQLDARGYRALTIANQTGLSTSRVRHWQQQFRQRRMGIFETGEPPKAAPRRPVPTYRVSEIVDRGDGAVTEDSAPEPPRSVGDGSPSQIPFAEGPTVAVSQPSVSGPAASTEAEPAEAEPTPVAGEAEVPPAPMGDPADLADLLEMFQPGDTDTPLLADDPEPRAPEVPARAPAHRRTFLAPDTPILHAAHDTLAYYLAAYHRAALRFQDAPAPRDAQRLLLAAHRVRLALDVFAAYVPETAAARLSAALRPLAAALDHVVELERAVLSGADVGAERDEALDAARPFVSEARHRIWMERAERLLQRLAEQIRSGLLIGDDFPLVSDDWVGEPGSRPVPSRLRHILASVLWDRYESVRAFEDEVEEGVTSLSAHHLAVAVSGLHFALGLASKASDADVVREAASRLDAAEQTVAAFRTATRAATGETTDAEVRTAWGALDDADFRDLLGRITAAI